MTNNKKHISPRRAIKLLVRENINKNAAKREALVANWPKEA